MTQYSDTGELLTQSKIIEKELYKMWPGLSPETIKSLAAYVLQRIDDDHWPTLNQGRAIGLSEAIAMFETVIGEDEPRDSWSDPIIPATRNDLKKEQRKALAQLVAAISKSLEEKT